MKILCSIILSAFLLSACNVDADYKSYIVKSDLIEVSRETEYNIEDGVIKLDKSQKDETLPIAGRVCIKAVYNEKTKQFDIVPCK